MSQPGNRPFVLYAIVAVGLMGFSVSPILVKLAVEAPGEAVAVWRTFFACVLLAPFAWPRVAPEIRTFTKRDRRLILAAGVVLGFHFITWIESLYHTSVASASILASTSPIFLAFLGFWILRERLARPTWIAIITAVIGSLLIGYGDASDAAFPNALLGNSLALVAAMTVSAYMLLGRVIRRKTSWLAYIFPLYVVGCCTTLVYALVRGVPLFGYSWEIYALCLAMAVFPQILGHGSFNYALKFLPAAVLALLGLSEPIIASIIAYFLFTEVPAWIAVIGMVIVLFAIAGALTSPFRNRIKEMIRDRRRDA